MIFFDLDGTLYRTHETSLPVLRLLCDSYGIKHTKEDEERFLITTADAFLDRAAPDMPVARREAFKVDLRRNEREAVRTGGRLFEGAGEMLAELRASGFSLAICGMGSEEYISCVLDRCGIRDFFDTVLCRIDGQTKSQVLSEFLGKRQLRPEDCILIGDSNTDFVAAGDNCIPFIGVSYGYGVADIRDKAVMADCMTQIIDEIYKTLIYARIEKDIKIGRKSIVIGVSGVDASGKTFFADGLGRYLEQRGLHNQIIHLDDFHNPRAIRKRDDSPQGYIDFAFNLQQLHSVLTEIKSGSMDRDITVLDLDSDTYTKTIHVSSKRNTIFILEGVMLFRPPIVDLLDYKIYLDIDFDEVIRRAGKRDIPKYGTGILDRYANRYIPAQQLFLSTYKPGEICDLLIDNNNYRRPHVIHSHPPICPA